MNSSSSLGLRAPRGHRVRANGIGYRMPGAAGDLLTNCKICEKVRLGLRENVEASHRSGYAARAVIFHKTAACSYAI